MWTAIPERELANLHRVIMADNGFFTDGTVNATLNFYNRLPLLHREKGVLGSWGRTTYAVNTQKNSWPAECEGTGYNPGIEGQHSYNVFQNQWGSSTENAFPSPVSRRGDLHLTVTRHEVAHQFDRILFAIPTQKERLDDLRALSFEAGDYSYPRSPSISAEFFQNAHQEIIASNVGNQYCLSSLTQLQLCVDRLSLENRGGLCLAWHLFFVDFFSEGTTTAGGDCVEGEYCLGDQVRYYEESAQRLDHYYYVDLKRGEQNRVTTITLNDEKTVHIDYDGSSSEPGSEWVPTTIQLFDQSISPVTPISSTSTERQSFFTFDDTIATLTSPPTRTIETGLWRDTGCVTIDVCVESSG